MVKIELIIKTNKTKKSFNQLAFFFGDKSIEQKNNLQLIHLSTKI